MSTDHLVPGTVAEQPRLVAGRYRLLSHLGVGGTGTVWRARDEVLFRDVAVKEVVLPGGLTETEREVMRERTRREARAAARLDHPSAVTVYDVVEQDGAPFLVMELVEARTLSQVVREQGPLDVRRTAQIGLALLGALETAHRQRIVHRDVKPGNVLLGDPVGADAGRVVLTDFGLASAAGDASITGTGMLLGSPAFIAPERARGQSPGPESDLWSLGATLFCAVEGRPPYDGGGDALRTVTEVVTGERVPFLRAGALAPVLDGLLRRDPYDRMDAAAARAALVPLAAGGAPSPRAGEASSPTTPSRTGELPSTDGSRGPVLTSAATDDALQGDTAQLPITAVGAALAGTREPDPEPTERRSPGHTDVHADPRPRPRTGYLAPSGRPSAHPLRPVGAARLPLLPEPARAPRRSRVPLVLLCAVLVAGAAVGGYVLSGQPSTATRLADRVQPRPQVQPTAAASPTLPAVQLPDGWTSYTDPDQGWSIGVPPGYQRSDRRGEVQLRNDIERRTLRVDVQTADGTALDRWRAFSGALAGSLADYRQLRVAPVDFRDLDAADLAFTYTDQTRLQVLDRGFVVPRAGAPDAFYALYWQTNADDFQGSAAVFEQLLSSFRPAP